ncbi:MAG: hypothetical protein A4E62_00636 [Syntrophorhabdus sp. PtaU1.Bin002]|nr:MAG: hypothetical protein A4E62_00636 [Syntrophorhabdus sp. PtaU1.Bin002]
MMDKVVIEQLPEAKDIDGAKRWDEERGEFVQVSYREDIGHVAFFLDQRRLFTGQPLPCGKRRGVLRRKRKDPGNLRGYGESGKGRAHIDKGTKDPDTAQLRPYFSGVGRKHGYRIQPAIL